MSTSVDQYDELAHKMRGQSIEDSSLKRKRPTSFVQCRFTGGNTCPVKNIYCALHSSLHPSKYIGPLLSCTPDPEPWTYYGFPAILPFLFHIIFNIFLNTIQFYITAPN
jgi:hypothetical protein